MSRGHLACFKHYKRNCKCNSPRQLGLHHSARLPKDGDRKKWKEFAYWLIGRFKYSRSFRSNPTDHPLIKKIIDDDVFYYLGIDVVKYFKEEG